ncbi:Kinesin-like protein kif27 [Dinochytrium kinnereticum]|nr:Kinesin-like protein kif27 [Dinochytrium kinnereticum]
MEKSGKGDGALLPTSIADSWVDRLTKFYLIPEGPFLANWERFMVLLTVISCVLISFMAAFKHFTEAAWSVSYIIDLFHLIDIYIKFHVAYLQNGFWVVFPKEMAVHYLHSMEFKLDIMFSLPVDIIALGWAGTGWKNFMYIVCLTRLFKILRAARLLIFFRRQERKLHASSAVQIIKFAAYLITLTHSIACIWFAIACPGGEAQNCETPSWARYRGLVGDSGYRVPLGSLYVEAVYWTVTTMTTTGYGDITPQNDSERIFAFITQTAGIFFYNYVTGTIASALSNMDSRRVSYQQKMDAVRQYMGDRDMDSDMQERVLDYYDYMWERNKGIDVKNLFEDMPSTFRSEVGLSLNNAIIEKANIFQGTSIGFRRMIAIAMKLYLFTADEYVVHRGDLGLEMYFITQGRIDIYSTDDVNRPTASLVEGAHFGEFQIILGFRHEYSARAVCNTDIYVLFKDDLQTAFEAYPQDKELVINATRERYAQAVSARKSRNISSAPNLEKAFGGHPDGEAQANSEFDPPNTGGGTIAFKSRKESGTSNFMRDKFPTSSSTTDIKSKGSKDYLAEQKKKGHKSMPPTSSFGKSNPRGVLSPPQSTSFGPLETSTEEDIIATSNPQNESEDTRGKPSLQKNASGAVLDAEEGKFDS